MKFEPLESRTHMAQEISILLTSLRHYSFYLFRTKENLHFAKNKSKTKIQNLSSRKIKVADSC